MPDAYERTLPEVFPDFAPGSFTWDDELDGWVWTTFNDYQWDVNWANPDVLCEFADIILDLANHGVEVFRLDAIAFTLEAAGHRPARTSPRCTRSPRRCARSPGSPCPAVLFKAEAIVGPQDLLAYLGAGRAPRQGQRPRLPQQPDGADLVDARQPATPGSPRTPCSSCRRRRRRPPGSPTCAATTTSAGRSTTTDAAAVGLDRLRAPAVPLRLLRRRVPRARGRAGWSSRRTRPPATGGSPARSPRWPGCEAGDPRRRRADPARARDRARLRRPAGDLDGRRARPAQRPGLGRRARRTPTTTAGCTGRGCRGRSPRRRRTASSAGVRPPGRAPARRCRTCTPRSPTEVLDPRDPGRAARRPPPPARPDARGLQRDRPRRPHVPSDVFHWLGMAAGDLHDHLVRRAADVRRRGHRAGAVRRRVADRR